MNIFEYANALGLTMTTRYFGGRQNARYSVGFDGVDFTDGHLLMSVCGYGESRQSAVIDFVKRIEGKRLVVNSMRSTRVEYVVPRNISADLREVEGEW